MNIKSEKGITNIDITVSVILITLFVSLIETIATNINSNSKNIRRKTEALNYAINEIEDVKASNFEDLDKIYVGSEAEGNIENSGFYKKITITDYADLDKNKDDDTIKRDIVKIVKVEISYKQGKDTQTVDLSTVVTKK